MNSGCIRNKGAIDLLFKVYQKPENTSNKEVLLIPQLLDKKKRATVADLSESMECLCYLMKTVGPRLDIPKAKVWCW